VNIVLFILIELCEGTNNKQTIMEEENFPLLLGIIDLPDSHSISAKSQVD
jgi:hypothetical protein